MSNASLPRVLSQTETSFDLGGSAAVRPYDATSLCLVDKTIFCSGDTLVVIASQKAPSFALKVDQARKSNGTLLKESANLNQSLSPNKRHSSSGV